MRCLLGWRLYAVLIHPVAGNLDEFAALASMFLVLFYFGSRSLVAVLLRREDGRVRIAIELVAFQMVWVTVKPDHDTAGVALGVVVVVEDRG